MLTFKDDEVKRQIESEVGIRPSFALEAFTSLEDDVKQSIAHPGKPVHSQQVERSWIRL